MQLQQNKQTNVKQELWSILASARDPWTVESATVPARYQARPDRRNSPGRGPPANPWSPSPHRDLKTTPLDYIARLHRALS